MFIINIMVFNINNTNLSVKCSNFICVKTRLFKNKNDQVVLSNNCPFPFLKAENIKKVYQPNTIHSKITTICNSMFFAN